MANHKTPKCDYLSTTISKNGQYRPKAVSICFWNQGTTEVIIDGNFRLAPATLDTATNTYRGGEAYAFSHPQGYVLEHTFNITFNPTSISPQIKNLTVQQIYNVSDEE